MTTEAQLQGHIAQALYALYEVKTTPQEVALQPTRKDFEGTYTFVTFQLTKTLKKSPLEVGQSLGEYLVANSPIVSGFNVVQGFLNIGLNDSVWLSSFQDIYTKPDFGTFASKGQQVMVEYSSPNTNKPLHLGHLRNNFLGYSVAEILKANGYEVRKTNIVNNRGVHICKSMYAYQQANTGETPGNTGIKGDHLVGKYYVAFDKQYKAEIQELMEKGVPKEQAEKEAPSLLAVQEMLRQWEAGNPEVLALWNLMNSWVYAGFDSTYEQIGVNFDKIYYESDTYLLGKQTVEEGLASGVFFKKENGSVWIDLTAEGLDQKLVLRADGTSVYITQDLGLADLKQECFPMQKSVYVVGNEQDYHFEVLFKIMKKLNRPYANGLFHLSYGMVDLPSGKMKSREGTVVDADDLVQEMIDTAEAKTKELGKIDGFTETEAKTLYHTLALGALKYFLLKVDPKKRMLFNPEESVEFQGNTGPFIQYTHARICAIVRKATQMGLPIGQVAKPTHLHKTEQELIFTLSQYPSKVQAAGEAYAPSIVAQYVYDLAKTYNQFYAEVSVFHEQDTHKQLFRVQLSAMVASVIKKAMGLLGANVPERM